MTERVEKALDSLRPFFQQDGGDVELLSVDQGVAVVRLTGACAACPFAEADIQGMVEQVVREAVPEIKAVEAVLY
ncbi:MAG TPA: NifU family protein [Dehalococcoidia bacterium]|nr:NifU family protein [Dehalococcoidia bacterium]